MNPIETLMTEHRLIERALAGLEAYAAALQAGADLPREDLRTLVAFFREFADVLHHHKEEELLFQAMVEHGFPREAGPIAVMLHEHDQGRRLVRALAEVAAGATPWTPAEREEVAFAAHGYAGMLRQHIHKEDRILYPMAEANLPPAALEDVGNACDRYDTERAGESAAHVGALEDVLSRTGAGDTTEEDSSACFSCGGGEVNHAR